MKRFFCLSLIFGLLIVLPDYLYAQACTNQSRVYANSQFEVKSLSPLSSGSISSPANAVDDSPLTNSTMNLSVILTGSITQFLEFKEADKATRKLISGPQTIYIKVSLPATFLNLGGSIDIGTFKYTTGSSYTQTQKYNGANLVGLISGPGTVEIPLTLAAGESVNGVYVKLVGGIASIPISTDIYGAYILENTTAIPDCDRAIDVLTGLSDNSVLPVGSAFGTIANPESAIDGLAYTSYASLSAGINVLNSAYLTAVFGRPSVAGDSVKIILQDLGGGLNLLSGLAITPYLGSNAGATVGLGNVTSRAVPGYPGLTEISFAVNASFDRVRISYGGLVGLSGSVRIYNVTKAIPKPQPTIDGILSVEKAVCFASPPTILSVNNIQACTTYNWYADLTTPTSLYTGSAYSLSGLSVGTHIYYVESRRDNCISSVSERVKVTIIVNPLPTVSVTDATTCYGTSAALSVNNPVGGIAYRWYDAFSAGRLLYTGNTYNTPSLLTNTTYFIEAYNTSTGCVSSSRSPLSVTVKPLATLSSTTGVASVCSGSAITLSNTTTGGNWSSLNNAIATVSASGVVTGISGGSTIIRYTIADSPVACANSSDFSITVNNLPSLTLVGDPEICAGFISSSLSYTNAQYNPVSYSISWSSTELISITDQALPANNIPFDVPAHIAPGTYPGTLTIRNDHGCSTSINFNLKVNQRPPTPHVLVPISSQY